MSDTNGVEKQEGRSGHLSQTSVPSTFLNNHQASSRPELLQSESEHLLLAGSDTRGFSKIELCHVSFWEAETLHPTQEARFSVLFKGLVSNVLHHIKQNRNQNSF